MLSLFSAFYQRNGNKKHIKICRWGYFWGIAMQWKKTIVLQASGRSDNTLRVICCGCHYIALCCFLWGGRLRDERIIGTSNKCMHCDESWENPDPRTLDWHAFNAAGRYISIKEFL